MLRRELFLLAVFALATNLVACRSRVSFRSPTLTASAAPLPVTLSTELRLLRAHDSTGGGKTTFKVGNLLQPLFVSGDGRTFLSLVAADIRIERAVTAWDAQYTLTLSLQRDGTSQRIEAAGRGSSADDPRTAGSTAVEACVQDVYSKVASVLSRRSR